MVYEPKRIYSWGGRSYGVPAQKVGEHFEALEKEHGAVTRELFLQSAEPEDSPFHKLFEWDDERAANLYRLQQSNQVINSLCVEVRRKDGESQKVTAFVNVSVRNVEEARYVNIRSAMNDEEKRRNVLDDAKRELSWFVSKYEKYQWFDKLRPALDEFLAEH